MGAVPGTVTAPSGRFRGLQFALAAGVLVVDQGTKAWALHALTPGRSVELIGSWLQLQLIRNSGAAFSLGNGATWILTAVAVVLVGVLVRHIDRIGDRRWAYAWGILLGGALGNLADRFLREPGPGRGHVVDFIDYFGLFIGNVADIAIVGAAAYVAVLAYRGIPLRGMPTTTQPDTEEAP